ncbi:ABC-type glycerol-3-phosphate transport system, substrate-binding protein [Ruminococcaceae bacterium YRB3002]|nr:ABC-type glycerol-3-phosphate transport system, substrate-binding protein [Ruminococcaceae bacterium YRB3002]
MNKGLSTILIIAFILLSLVGCSVEDNNYINDSDLYYSSRRISIDGIDIIERVNYMNDNYILFGRSHESYGYELQINYKVYSFDGKGIMREVATITDEALIDCFAIDVNKIVIIKPDELLIQNTENETCSRIDQGIVRAVKGFPDNGGFVVVCDGSIYRFDMDGTCMGMIESDDLSGIFLGYWREGDKAYISVENDGKVNYICVDWDDNDTIKITDNTHLGLDYRIAITGGHYCIDDQSCDMYEINLDDLSQRVCVRGQDMMIPPSLNGYSDYGSMVVLDKEHIVSLREYDTGCEAVCVEADPNLDLSDRSKIVIGCTDLINEPAIKLAAYLYNSSQDEYMAVIEEYKMDYNDLDQSRVELLRMFNEGNTPDIICSNYFDYRTWGENGMVEDLMPFIQNDPVWSKINPVVKDTCTTAKGNCYNLYSSYSLLGFSTISSSEWTIDRIIALDDDVSVFGDGIGADILLEYSVMGELARARISGQYGDLDEDRLLKLLEYATAYGVPVTGTPSDIRANNNVYHDILLVYGIPDSCGKVIGLDQNITEDIHIVGFPGIEGTYIPIIPHGNVAIFSSSEHVDECYNVIRYLFDDEVQQICFMNVNCGIPSSASAFDEEAENLIQEQQINDMQFRLLRRLGDCGDYEYVYDSGLTNIIYEELDRYYFDDVPLDQIAASLRDRLMLYCEENY